MNRRLIVLARVVAAVAVVLSVLTIVFGTMQHSVTRPLGAISFLTFAVVGLVIVQHQPRNAVGWVFLTSSMLIGFETTGDASARVALAQGWAPFLVKLGAWFSSWPWFAGIFGIVTVGMLRFPDGGLLSSRWRWVERVAVAGMTVFSVSLAVLAALVPARALLSDNEPATSGPARLALGVGFSMFPIVAVCVLLTAVSLILRYRRGDQVLREQLRWVLSAVIFAIVLEAANDGYSSLNPHTYPGWVQTIIETVGFGLIAVATAVAITRYRLYEIDRIVSRTVTYASVLVVLAGVYIGVVVGLSALVPGDLGQLGVVAATLSVTVLAVPLTRRVRRVVDRRFNRSRFDAERIVTAFASRLRARPDRGDIGVDLVDVLARTVQPSHATLWVAGQSIASASTAATAPGSSR